MLETSSPWNPCLTSPPKKSKFYNRHFSPVSTNFWILSSGIGRTWCELASKLANFQRFDEKNIEKFVTKSENSNFVDFFRPRKTFLFFYKYLILQSQKKGVDSVNGEVIAGGDEFLLNISLINVDVSYVISATKIEPITF